MNATVGVNVGVGAMFEVGITGTFAVGEAVGVGRISEVGMTGTLIVGVAVTSVIFEQETPSSICPLQSSSTKLHISSPADPAKHGTNFPLLHCSIVDEHPEKEHLRRLTGI